MEITALNSIIRAVDFEKGIAVFSIAPEDKFTAGKYWLIPAPKNTKIKHIELEAEDSDGLAR